MLPLIIGAAVGVFAYFTYDEKTSPIVLPGADNIEVPKVKKKKVKKKKVEPLQKVEENGIEEIKE